MTLFPRCCGSRSLDPWIRVEFSRIRPSDRQENPGSGIDPRKTARIRIRPIRIWIEQKQPYQDRCGSATLLSSKLVNPFFWSYILVHTVYCIRGSNSVNGLGSVLFYLKLTFYGKICEIYSTVYTHTLLVCLSHTCMYRMY